MKIEILGTGCSKCKRLMENTQLAVKESKIQAEIVKVEDIQKIMSYGVMSTPALVVDGQIKVMGKIPTVVEIQNLLKS